MNKKMRDLLSKIEGLRNEAKTMRDEKDFDGAKGKLREIEELQKEYEVEKALFESERDGIDPDAEGTHDGGKEKKSLSGFAVISKLFRRQSLDETEKALITGTNSASGENYLVPEDVRLEINELRKSYVSAKELVTVVPTDSLTGSFNFESGTPTGLTDFDDGDAIGEETNPTFVKKAFTIGWRGKLIPISNILKGSEKAGLMAYINSWFVKNAIISENAKIFAILKTGKTAKALKGLQALKSSIIKDLDPSALVDGVIATNQTGFDEMTKEADATGNPMMTSNIANPEEKKFYGLPIKVYPDAQLPNVSGKAPIFYGSTKAGGYFMDKNGLEFAVSEHYGFNKNQSTLRVIEGFDVIQADADAYIYGTFEADTAKVVNTKTTTT